VGRGRARCGGFFIVRRQEKSRVSYLWCVCVFYFLSKKEIVIDNDDD
jgi:hypothetical protein